MSTIKRSLLCGRPASPCGTRVPTSADRVHDHGRLATLAVGISRRGKGAGPAIFA